MVVLNALLALSNFIGRFLKMAGVVLVCPTDRKSVGFANEGKGWVRFPGPPFQGGQVWRARSSVRTERGTSDPGVGGSNPSGRANVEF